MKHFPDSKVHGANMGPTWVLSAPGGSHVGPMNLAIWSVSLYTYDSILQPRFLIGFDYHQESVSLIEIS